MCVAAPVPTIPKVFEAQWPFGVFVGNSYLCIGGYNQNATPTGRLGSCNLRGFYRCLGLQKKDTYVILATTQTTYPLHPQLLLYPHHQPHNKTQHSRWCPEGLLPSSTHTTMATNIWSTKNHGSTLPYIIINAAANYFYHSYHIHRRILSWGTSLFHYFPPPSLTSTSVALTLHMKQRCDRPLLPNR